jgi:predicted ribosome quality control (RQC) complex YloA/Tae2 family protein
MMLPGWQLVRILAEASAELLGSVVETVRWEPRSTRLLIIMGSRRGKRLMVIGLRGERHVVYWVRKKAELPGAGEFQSTERFNRLRGARLIELDMPQADRLIRLGFRRPEGADPPVLDFWLAWTGKSGNAWLVDPGKETVIEAQWGGAINRVGGRFQMPSPPPLIDWRTMTFPCYLSLRREYAKKELGEFLSRKLWGIDGALAKVIAERVDGAQDDVRSRWREFQSVIGALRQTGERSCPLRLTADGSSILPILDDGSAESSFYTSICEAMAVRDQSLGEETGRNQRLSAVGDALAKRIRQAQRRLQDAERAIASADEAEVLKRHADLLGVQRHLIRRGMSEVTSSLFISAPARPAVPPRMRDGSVPIWPPSWSDSRDGMTSLAAKRFPMNESRRFRRR